MQRTNNSQFIIIKKTFSDFNKHEKQVIEQMLSNDDSMFKNFFDENKPSLTLDHMSEYITKELENIFTEESSVEALLRVGVPKEIAEVLTEIAKERIRVSAVKVRGVLNLTCTKPDGVLRIKEALLKAKKSGFKRGSNIRIYVIAPPKYQVEVAAKDYKEANAILKKVADTAISTITRLGGQGSFKSE